MLQDIQNFSLEPGHISWNFTESTQLERVERVLLWVNVSCRVHGLKVLLLGKTTQAFPCRRILKLRGHCCYGGRRLFAF